ncbi:pentatricopeptide repeat-containing protein At4g02750-like [Selaginella moellendorffii]|uniref:pentatricopeptide repeat-containing protein At4g02750-like n=1 Tax=Selaginella moellendorffii TaxID=88036 RepID=UPI000D1C5CF0|nr:pentatricopeptide repeat-containing protein At4g02750-like [Selaginella moellendorffii]|eukprot:XP_024539680.1 pentatricopeptide repeat-containing protein At4g02750-like [Selaginella moellendorffii]
MAHTFSSPFEIVALLKSCKDLAQGRQIHAQISASKHHSKNIALSNLLVKMYGRCGSLDDAWRVFDGLDQPNVYSWNIMIRAYTENGDMLRARALFDKMAQKNVVSWTTIIESYGRSGNILEAENLFELMPDRDVVSCNVMIEAFAQNGHLQAARRLFNEMDDRDVATWTTMITAYSQRGDLVVAREFFEGMPYRSIVSWSAMVTGYGQNGQLQQSRWVFESMPERNLLTWTVMVANGNILQAEALFNLMPCQNLIAKNTIMDAYASHGQIDKARFLFDQSLERNLVSWTTMITAYARNGHLEMAKDLFDQMPERDTVSWNTLINAYAQQGFFDEALDILSQMPWKDVVSWNIIIAANAQNGENEQAIALFRQMDLEGIPANEITFITVLDACTTISDLKIGRAVHAEAVTSGIGGVEAVTTAAITMCGKSGSLPEATRLFQSMPVKSTVAWGAMITIYAQGGQSEIALDLFRDMELDGIQADGITFIAVLSACCHCGRFREGWEFFVSLRLDYGVEPMAEHYECLVDQLGRAGKLREAEELIESMPFYPTPVAYTQLLSAVKTQEGDQGDRGNTIRSSAENLATKVQELDDQNSSSYVLLSTL